MIWFLFSERDDPLLSSSPPLVARCGLSVLQHLLEPRSTCSEPEGNARPMAGFGLKGQFVLFFGNISLGRLVRASEAQNKQTLQVREVLSAQE